MPNHITSNVPLRQIAEPKRRWLYAPSVVGLAVTVWLLVSPPDTIGLEKVASWLVGGGTAIIVLLHFLVSRQNPFNRMVSDYAESSRFGFLMNIAFVCIGIAGVLLGVAFARYMFQPFGITLSLSGMAIVFLSVFTTGSSLKVAFGKPEGWYHDLFVGIGFSLVIYSMAQLGATKHGRDGFDWVNAVAFCQLGISLVAGMALGVVALNRVREVPQPVPSAPAVGQGLCERVLILLLIEWVAFLCWALHAALGFFFA